MRIRRPAAFLAAAALTAAIPLAAATPALAVPAAEAVGTRGIGGYSSGTVVAGEVVTGEPGTLANITVAQSAADASVGRELVDEDVLGNAVLFATEDARAGRNAYGHGSSVGVGVGQAENAVPQVAPAVAEALSPPPAEAEPGGGALPAELAPLIEAAVLPSTAQARTTSVDSICPDGAAGGLVSEGTAEAANASLLNVIPPTPPATENGGVLMTGGVVSSESQTLLEGGALTTVTTQSIAPLTLFEGTEAQLDIDVVHRLQLRATATGGEGSELFYGFVDDEGQPVADSEPVLFINGEGLTTEQVLGTDGLRLGLGVADVIIGGPAHGLDDDPTSDPTVSATTVAGASDLVRVTVPGVLEVPAVDPIAEDSPLAPLNDVLNPIIEGIGPITEQIQAGLQEAGITAADLRVGHLEALAVVPVGGIVCAVAAPDDPLAETMKDVSARSVAPGGTFDYVIRFPNRGAEPLEGVRVVDTFSEELELVGGEGFVTPQEGEPRELEVPVADGNTVTIEVGTVEPNAFVVITLTFRVPDGAADGTEYRNDAVITATYRGAEITKQVGVDGPTVTDTFTGGCDVSRSTKYASNEQVRTGDQFAYVVNISNTGAETCTGVTVTDELVDGVEFVSCSDDCTADGQAVRWEIGDLAGGSTTTVSVIVRVTATSGTLPNTAVISTDQGSRAEPSTPGPEVTDESVVAPGNPAGCPSTGCPQAPPAQARTRLPATGAADALPALALLAAGGGVALVRRRLSG